MTYQEVTADGKLNQVVEKPNLWGDSLDVVVPYKNTTKHTIAPMLATTIE